MNDMADNSISVPVKKLSGQVAVVTGASRGIGASVAKSLAEAGASLVLTELPERMDALQAFSADLERLYKIKAMTVGLDVTKYIEIKQLIEQIKNVFGHIDILVNNAGINMLVPALQVSPEQWDRILDVNLKGSFFVTQEAAKLMIPSKKGSIIFIASQHGVVGNEHRAPYCASKAALIHLCKALAIEWSKYGIRINAISPTFVETSENEAFLQDANFLRVQLPRIPLRRMAKPSDIAEAVLFLASNSSNMITGHNLIIDGGWTAQ
ncbi:SDR family oxidoreductase [Paenibacillus tritici]|uniref:SDR family oxidoreductase n=1 Tax=Paenibacillus tritici TaxID=1873425 RepID=A0ABX2DSB4_9BACL|nr:SDR family oxidoreductase [Paenibacillus tritici]NQX47562.1 SDR family oxidoreductase [Paenibacillus tritici]